MKRSKLSGEKYFRKKGAPESKMVLSPVFKKISRPRTEKYYKESGNLRARSHPVKFPTCKKGLKRSLESGVAAHMSLIPALRRQRLVNL